jgi:hypothetical protein
LPVAQKVQRMGQPTCGQACTVQPRTEQEPLSMPPAVGSPPHEPAHALEGEACMIWRRPLRPHWLLPEEPVYLLLPACMHC